MDNITEMLNRISELSEEELSALRETIVTTFNELSKQELNKDVANQMTELGTAAQAVKSEETRRVEELAALEQAKASAAALVNGDPVSTEETSEEEPTPVVTVKTDDDEEEEVVVPKKKPVETVAVASVEEVQVTEPVAETEASTETTEPVAELAVEEPSTEDTENAETAPEAEPSEDGEPEVLDSEEKEVEEEKVEETVEQEEAPVEEAPEEQAVKPVSVEETSEEEEETMTASANTEGLEIEVPAGREVEAKDAELTPVTITAGADIPGVSAGSQLPNLRAVAQALLDRKRGMGRTSGGDGEQHTVATFTTSYPEDRLLISNDFDGNTKKVENVVSEQAIVAAGGLCAPVEARYEIFGLGELGRPVRDSLAVFSADRGGIRFVAPPVLTDLDGAVSLWTLQDDIDAATEGGPDPVKPCIRVACGAEVTVYTDAIPLCLTFGNMGARAYPELVERHTQLGMISHARFAETRLLTRIGALSTSVSTGTELGAARDIFVAVDQAAAAYRNRHRMDDDSRLRVIFPAWFKNALRADLTKQIPGDGDENTFALAESKINSWFSVRGIEVTWAMDGETGQIMGAQAAGALNNFPTNVIWYLFAEGTFLFLDGGTLDLGLVRDSTLNGTNDYKIFLETFEAVTKVGIESLRVTSTLAIKGSSSGTQDLIV